MKQPHRTDPKPAGTDRLRVLMVTGAYYPEVSGGGLQCRTLATALGGKVDVTILTTTAMPSAPRLDTVDGIPVHRVFVDVHHPSSKLSAAWHMLRMLPGLIRKTSVVHLHGFTTKMLPIVLLAKARGVPVIAKMTSLGHDDPGSLRVRMGWLAFRVFAMADRFVSISPPMTDCYLGSTLSPDRLSFLPNGVDVERFKPVGVGEQRALRVELGLPLDARIVIFVGFWSREKAPDLLFEAWHRVASRHDVNTFLVFVGATRDHGEVDAAFVRSLRSKIDESGAGVRIVDATLTIERYLSAADVFVLPSAREGLPNALLEAMASGLACVSTRIGGLTDWVLRDGETGVIVPAGDVDALAEAIDASVRDLDRSHRMGSDARRAVIERFSIGAVARRYYDLYETLARTRVA